jgi:hypothetical protein
VEEKDLKILSIGNFGQGWDGSICDEEHIASALEELGHKVTRVQRGEVNTNDGSNDYDFTLIAQWDGYGDTLSWLPRPLVYWAFDYQAYGQEWHEKLVKEADLYLSKRIADSKYPNWQWLAQDFSPNFLDKKTTHYLIDKDIDVLFTGSYLPWATERNETIKAVNENFKLVVHSVNDWPFLQRRPPVMDHDLIDLYARAKVVLSIDHTLEAGYWSDRNAQAMCCGAFVLSRYVPLMESRFHDNIGYFWDIKTCLENIEHWLTIDEDREAFAQHGYEYAQNNMKTVNRVDDLITIVRGIL